MPRDRHNPTGDETGCSKRASKRDRKQRPHAIHSVERILRLFGHRGCWSETEAGISELLNLVFLETLHHVEAIESAHRIG